MMWARIGLVGLAVFGWGGGQAAAAGEASGLAVGAKAPNFFVSTYNPKASGATRVFLDKLVGDQASEKKKLLLLSFFNIDCKPCRKELPFLQKLHDKYKDAGLGVVVVNCDFKQDKIAEVEKYVAEAAFTFPVLKDRFQALQRRYAIGSFPTMYLVDSQGLIIDVRVGYNEQTMPFPLADVQRRLGVAAEPLGQAADEVAAEEPATKPPVRPAQNSKKNKKKAKKKPIRPKQPG
jgi:thiol-disulfide isomerase/thioredoxin